MAGGHVAGGGLPLALPSAAGWWAPQSAALAPLGGELCRICDSGQGRTEVVAGACDSRSEETECSGSPCLSQPLALPVTTLPLCPGAAWRPEGIEGRWWPAPETCAIRCRWRRKKTRSRRRRRRARSRTPETVAAVRWRGHAAGAPQMATGTLDCAIEETRSTALRSGGQMFRRLARACSATARSSVKRLASEAPYRRLTRCRTSCTRRRTLPWSIRACFARRTRPKRALIS